MLNNWILLILGLSIGCWDLPAAFAYGEGGCTGCPPQCTCAFGMCHCNTEPPNQCSINEDCPAEQVCLPSPMGGNICASMNNFPCSADADCWIERTALSCQPAPETEARRCRPLSELTCLADLDCPSGSPCDSETGHCAPIPVQTDGDSESGEGETAPEAEIEADPEWDAEPLDGDWTESAGETETDPEGELVPEMEDEEWPEKELSIESPEAEIAAEETPESDQDPSDLESEPPASSEDGDLEEERETDAPSTSDGGGGDGCSGIPSPGLPLLGFLLLLLTRTRRRNSPMES